MQIITRSEFHDARVREDQLLRLLACGDITREEFARRNAEFVAFWDSVGDSYTSIVDLANGLVNEGYIHKRDAERVLGSVASQTKVLEAYGINREKFRAVYYGNQMDGVHAVAFVAYSCPKAWGSEQISSLHQHMALAVKPKPIYAGPKLEVIAGGTSESAAPQEDKSSEQVA